jgi:phage terminase small subunit
MKTTSRGIKTAIDGLNEDAAAYYIELKAILEKDGRFKPGDERPLARLCHLYSIGDKLENEVNEAWGVTLPKNNLPLYDKIAKNILSLESAFHLNPNSRKEKIKKEEKKKKGFELGGMKAA